MTGLGGQGPGVIASEAKRSALGTLGWQLRKWGDDSSDRGVLQSSHDPSTARPDPSATLRAGVQTTHAENASGRSAQDDRQGGRRVERARSRQESGQSYRAPTLSRKSGPPPPP